MTTKLEIAKIIYESDYLDVDQKLNLIREINIITEANYAKGLEILQKRIAEVTKKIKSIQNLPFGKEINGVLIKNIDGRQLAIKKLVKQRSLLVDKSVKFIEKHRPNMAKAITGK